MLNMTLQRDCNVLKFFEGFQVPVFSPALGVFWFLLVHGRTCTVNPAVSPEFPWLMRQASSTCFLVSLVSVNLLLMLYVLQWRAHFYWIAVFWLYDFLYSLDSSSSKMNSLGVFPSALCLSMWVSAFSFSRCVFTVISTDALCLTQVHKDSSPRTFSSKLHSLIS